MFLLKKKYFFIIETINDIDLKKFKNLNKFNIIYRYTQLADDRETLKRFVKHCKSKKIHFYIANDVLLMRELKADGLYISASNKKIYSNLNCKKYKIIGAAHNLREFTVKKRQRCSEILLSRLFETNYKNKRNFFGFVKFNLLIKNYNYRFIPLGGINFNNLRILCNVNSEGMALSGQIKADNSFNRILY